MKIGILVAMSVEFRQLARLMEEPREQRAGGLDFTLGRIGAHEVVLMQCGIGKVNAALGTTVMVGEFGPDAVVSTGCAGGIDPVLRVMDVVVSRRLAYHDVDCGVGLGCERGQVQGLPRFFEGDPRLVGVAEAMGSRIHCGLILTGDQFITSRPVLDRIKADFPEGLAVDMESAAIAQVCYLLKVPFVSFRIVSDTPGADHHQQQYEDFWQEMADRSFGVTRDFLQSL